MNDLLSNIPVLANDILIVACGQTGANIGYQFNRLGYQVLYINTSSEDLKSIECPDYMKMHIAGMSGGSHNRNIIKEAMPRTNANLAKEILTRFSTYTHILLVGSLGGSSGSVLIPFLTLSLTSLSDKKVSTLCAVSGLNESKKSLANTIDAYNDLVKVSQNISNMYFIDNETIDMNNPRDIERSNVEVVKTMHSIFNLSSTESSLSTIDKQEVLFLLGTQGCVSISNIEPKQTITCTRIKTNKNFINEISEAEYLAYSCNENDFDDNLIKEISGLYGDSQEDTFKCFKNDDSSNLLLAFGLPMPQQHILTLKEYLNDLNTNNKRKPIINQQILFNENSIQQQNNNTKIKVNSLDALFKTLQ